MGAISLQGSCLKPSYSLRNQLLVSFGSTALVTITLVVILAIFSSLSAGYTLRYSTQELMRGQVFKGIRQSSRYMAETIAEKLENLQGASTIVAELVRDRIVGYPESGYEFDTYVPFFDRDSGTNIYPLRSPLLPLDWSVSGEGLDAEHAQERAGYEHGFDATRASLFFQGVCDPSETDPTSRKYFPNCTDVNNDVVLGGTIQPTETNWWLAQKASDLGILLKPLYEAQPDISVMGIYLQNMGAGMSVHFPGYTREPDSVTYISEGCDWMREINTYSGEPFATEDEIARCHPKGEQVSNRNYNPMERAFCRDQALHPGQHRIFGPYQATSNGLWILSFGEAVFDRRTGHFIACVTVDVAISGLHENLQKSLIADYEDVALIKFDGTFVTSSDDQAISKPNVPVNETGFIDDPTFRALLKEIYYEDAVANEHQWSQYLQNLRNIAIFVDRTVVSAYPLPLPPVEYDPKYKPEYLVVLRVDEQAFKAVEEIDRLIHRDVTKLIASTFAVGILGVAVVLFIVWIVSRVLTLPLNWMEAVAWKIVNHTDKRAGQALRVVDDEDDATPSLRFTPRTEIKELVAEFRRMIRGFSGEGSSTVAKYTFSEVSNDVTWQSCFQQLYRDSRTDTTGAMSSQMKITNGEVSENSNPDVSENVAGDNSDNNIDPDRITILGNFPKSSKGSTTNLHISRMNKGPLIQSSVHGSSDQLKQHLQHELDGQQIRVHQTSLFWWIVVLIVIPVIITNVAICTIVRRSIVLVLQNRVQLSEHASSDLALDNLNKAALLRASFAEEVLAEPIRDLYLITRLSGWLFFDGIERSEGFTDMDSATEECKFYPDDRSCPYYHDETRTPCDCAWNDPFGRECIYYVSDSRWKQRMIFMAQAQDADPTTGNRFNITYPEHDDLPNRTLWWSNISQIPGSWKGSSASGHETAYDRLRVTSALSVYKFPLYNYLNSRKSRKHIMGSYIGFQADGMFGGFGGCEYAMAQMAHFQSSDENKAAVVGGGLCPLGKFGYDPRCRDWYVAGKNASIYQGKAVHITPPYLFAVEKVIATSATSSLIDPVTGKHVAQTLIDYFPSGMFEALNDTDAYFSLVISTEADSIGSDAVVGPNYTVGSPPVSSDDLIMRYDDANSINRDQFHSQVTGKMKNGEKGYGAFSRLMKDGSEEALVMSFAPVNVRAVHPLRPDNFSRGVSVENMTVYSLGLSRRVEDLFRPFKEIESEMQYSLDRSATIYLVLVILVSIIGAAVTCWISVAVTKPMIILLRVTQNINARRVEDDMPPMQGGSREVNQVYSSFAKLYKIVRFSNIAFFSGNLKWAYHFVSDALQLFRKIKDQKAIAIASNNLGNTLLAMSAEKSISSTSKTCSQVDGFCCVKAAITHFDEAIRIGTRDFVSTDDENLKADFAQQLADRHFNRALLYLFSQLKSTCVCLPENAKELGYRDLARAKELDYDVRDFWLERKLILKNSDVYFERMNRRLSGLVGLDADEQCRAIWDSRELLDDADRLLFVAWDEESAPLFKEISRVGRLQQLETSAMLLEQSRNNEFEAARIGMRMFVEDEFLIDYAFRTAGNALLRFIKRESSSPWTDEAISSFRDELRKMTKYSKNASLDLGKNFVLCLEISSKNLTILPKIKTNCLLLFDEYFSKDDYFGFACGNTQRMELGLKELHGQKQRTAIELATACENNGNIKANHPTLPVAVQMIADSDVWQDNDTYILYVTDGSCLDTQSLAKVKSDIVHLNAARKTVTSIIIVGVDVIDDKFSNQCSSLCATSRSSEYIKATGDTLDTAFDRVTGLITSTSAPPALLRGMTMEKF